MRLEGVLLFNPMGKVGKGGGCLVGPNPREGKGAMGEGGSTGGDRSISIWGTWVFSV